MKVLTLSELRETYNDWQREDEKAAQGHTPAPDGTADAEESEAA